MSPTQTATSQTTTAEHKPRVRLGSRRHLYHVESFTRPGRFWVVDAYRLTCTCEAGRFGRGCRHLRLGLSYHEWREQRRRQLSAPPRLTSDPEPGCVVCEASTQASQQQPAQAPAGESVPQQTSEPVAQIGARKALSSYFE